MAAALPRSGGRSHRLLPRATGLALWLLSPPAGAEELLVASAVSLREPVVEIAERFEGDHSDTNVRLSFGASSVLAAQARAGAPIDALLSADTAIVDALEREGLVSSRFALVRNRLVVMRAEDVEVALANAEDLARPEIRRIAVAEYAVPVGRYAREWLTGRGLLDRLAPRMVHTEHARATLVAVDFGHADAAVVYATDVHLARSAQLAFEVPPAEQPRIVYSAAVLSGSKRRGLAERFLAFLRGDAARASLAAAGFAPAPRGGDLPAGVDEPER